MEEDNNNNIEAMTIVLQTFMFGKLITQTSQDAKYFDMLFVFPVTPSPYFFLGIYIWSSYLSQAVLC